MPNYRWGLPLLLVAAASQAQNTVTVPWAEFKDLYTQQLESSLKKQLGVEAAPLYTLDEADYQITLAENGASGRIALRGQALRGQPEPIALFGNELAVTGVQEAQGAALLSDGARYKLFIQNQEPFRLAFGVALAVQEDERSRFVALRAPAAVKNALHLTVPEGLRLIEEPGLHQADGSYFVAPGAELKIRFERSAATEAAPTVDTFSRIELQGAKLQLTAYFIPARATTAPLRVRLAGAQTVGTSLKPSWIKDDGDGSWAITLPRDWREPFSLDFEIAANAPAIALPRIDGNQGREGEFQIREPVEARITASAQGLQSGLPDSRLPPALRATAGVVGVYARLAEGALTLAIERFDAVSAPAMVLDAIHLYVSFSDNGAALSVLRLELPAQAGQKLEIKPIAGAEVWSLTVNGEPRSLYAQQSGQWVIPLAEGKDSVVELAYLQKGEKLGLKGRLEVAAPATGLAARRLNVAVALAERVELVAIEGDLEPAQGAHWPQVQGFTGRPYFFSQPFYRGAALNAAIFYKEPLDLSKEKRS